MDDIHNLKTRYRNTRDSGNIRNNFLRPCLKHFKTWKRCTFNFNSSALKSWAGSFVHIINDDVEIEILCDIGRVKDDRDLMLSLEHCQNQKEKEETIRRHKEKILLAAFGADSSLDNQDGFRNKYGWSLLHYMLATEKLVVKFAVNTISNDYTNIYHEKCGYFTFEDGTVIAHYGTFNESESAHIGNNDSVMVFSSKRPIDDSRREEVINDVDDDFGGTDSVTVLELSKETLEVIKENAPSRPPKREDFPIDDEPDGNRTPPPTPSPTSQPIDKKWEHQSMAIETFLYNKKNEYSIDENLIRRKKGAFKGILSMATGTGKTSTSLNIAKELIKKEKINKILIIPPNKKALCNQWFDTVQKWKIRHLDENLKFRTLRHFADYKEVQKFTKEGNFILVAKRDPEIIDFVLPLLDKHKTLIIYDEVHGVGEPGLRILEGKHEEFKYILGLSATPERKFDSEGTEFIFNEIGYPIFSYPLEKAIKNGTLCPFNYYEIKVQQSENTKKEISNIVKSFKARENKDPNLDKKTLYRQIADVRKTDENKIPSLKYFLNDKNGGLIKNSIIFCHRKEQGEEIGKFINQIGITFTRNDVEDAKNQQKSLDELANGKIDTIINCHVLSEGVDIRSLENVFLIASDKADLETIQRVGRCLRIDDENNPNKRANIIDLVLYENIENNNCIEAERRDWLRELSQVK